MQQTLQPVSEQARFESLDLIRGIAVLGILIMNINTFSNVFAYYMNPYIYGEPSQVDLITWHLTHIFADQKFYTIFSMLFGAGIMLMVDRAKTKGVNAGGVHYRRMGWLVLFGLVHGYVIWFGDILTTYAVTGLWVYLFAINSQPKTKIIVGTVLIFLLALLMWAMGFAMEFMPEADRAQMSEMFYPSHDLINEETKAYQGSFLDQLQHRLMFYSQNLANAIILIGPMRIGGGMLIGMALYQLGILTAEKDNRFYWKMATITLLTGFAFLAYDSQQLTTNNFNFSSLWNSFTLINGLGSALIALGYIALFCLWFKSNTWVWLKKKFIAVGRMAFTNYLTQSLIATFIFYNHGLGLFNQLQRHEQYYIVAGIFILQLVWSDWWLKRYHFGPLEWLWRTLTYGTKQPFKK